MDARPDPELRRLRMRAEVGAESPLWDERGNMVGLDQLPISQHLRHSIGRWAEQLFLEADAPWQAEGEGLHGRLVGELGPDYQVVFEGS